MRILHVIDSMRRGGAERMLVDIANRSVDVGHEVRVCVTREDSTMAGDLRPEVKLSVLGRRGRYDPVAPWWFARFLRAHRVQLVHLHARASLPFVGLGKLLSRMPVPILLHDHFGGIERDTSIPSYFRVAKYAIAHYVGVCDKLGAWARDAGVPADRISVIENAIDLSRFEIERSAALRSELAGSDVLLGVMVANQHPNKGIEVLLDAVAGSRHREKLRIVVVGEAPSAAYSQSLIDRRDQLGLHNTVAFLGARSDVPSVLHAADFALHTSHTESGPLVLVEYMACGLPLVATRTGSIGRRLSSVGIPGFVGAGKASDLTTELDRLVALSPAERTARGAMGKGALPRWDLRSVMDRWNDLYAQLAGGPPHAP